MLLVMMELQLSKVCLPWPWEPSRLGFMSTILKAWWQEVTDITKPDIETSERAQIKRLSPVGIVKA